MTTPHPAAPPPPIPARRLLATLAAAGAVAGLLIVVVFGWASPVIEHNKALALQAAIREVLKQPARCDTLYLVGGRLAAAPPPGTDAARLERVYLGYDQQRQPVGFAVVAGEPGFSDIVRVIFGYDPATRRLLGMKVIESRETPGLGDRIEKDSSFVSQFRSALAPLVGVKAGQRKPADPHQVDLITGATISSRAVVRIINHAIERLQPALERYRPEAP